MTKPFYQHQHQHYHQLSISLSECENVVINQYAFLSSTRDGFVALLASTQMDQDTAIFINQRSRVLFILVAVYK